MTEHASRATVLVTSRAEEAKRPPPGLNTCDLLKVLSNLLRIGPHQGLQMAERLYTQGYLSYPRTESTAYPPGFDLRGLVHDQTRHPLWCVIVRWHPKNDRRP